ncbi:hypothetical protein ACHWQZ_G011081 [Mnemiopsis leidyi]
MLYYILICLLRISIQLTLADEADEQREYDALFQEMMKCNPSTAAFAISVVKDGKVVVNKAYGKANREKDIDATIDTRFSIGSISKEFTGYMAGKQVQEKHYDWNDKITDIFAKKGIKMSLQGDFRNRTCTLEDALTHRTGIKMYDWLLTDDRNISRANWVTKYVPLFQEEKEMRSAFYYNNWLYTVVGYLVEIFGGKTFEEQVKESMFKPLEMTQTCFVSDKEFDQLKDGEFAQPYQEGGGDPDNRTLYPVPKRAMKYIGVHNPAGGIISTSGDMAKYMIAVIDAFNDKEGAKLSKAVLEDVTDPKTLMKIQLGDATRIEKPTFDATFKDSGYGYGHIIGTYRGYKYVNHGGSTYGHYSYITVIPSLNIGVFTVISGNNYLSKDMWRMQKPMHIYMLDKMMGEEMWLNATNICTFPQTWIKENTQVFEGAKRGAEAAGATAVPAGDAERIVGNYSNPVFPVLMLKLEESTLKFEMGNSNGSVVAIKQEGDQEKRLRVILNMPVDPLNLPDTEKAEAFVYYLDNSSKISTNQIEKIELELGPERYPFKRNCSTASHHLTLLLIGALIFQLLHN